MSSWRRGRVRPTRTERMADESPLAEPSSRSAQQPMVQVVVALPMALTLDGECLGTTSPTKLGGHDVEILLPTAQQHSDGRPYVGAPVTPGVREDIDWPERLAYFSPRGSVASWTGDVPLRRRDTVNISHVLRSRRSAGASSG
jgi:hypothetical protein